MEKNQQISLKFHGAKRLQKKLSRLRKSSAQRAIRIATTQAATPMSRAVRKRVPKRTGLLKKSIKRKIVKGRKGFLYNAIIGSDINIISEHQGRKYVPARIDHLVEFGFQHRNGKTIPAQSFLRAGFEASVQTCRKLLHKLLKQQIKKAARRK